MNRDEGTYRKVGDKYDEYVEIQKDKPAPERTLPPQKPYPGEPPHSDPGRPIFAAIGIGIGALLLILSALSFWTAASWANLDRDGAATGYTLVGFFLLIAGVGGILATYNHNFRVLTTPADYP